VADLSELIKKCEELERKDKNKALKFYEDSIFSLLKQNVKQQGEKDGLSHKYQNLILTVGLSPEPLILSITAIQPKQLFFLCTKQSEERYLDKIVKECNLRAEQWDKAVVESADASDVYEAVRNQWKKWKGNKKTAIDITGGTKPMVAGSGIAAAILGFDLLYVTSEFEWILRKSKPGTERIIVLSNPFDVFGDIEEDKGIELFNTHNYSLSWALFNQLKEKVSDPRKIEVESILAKAYGEWDRFDYPNALMTLKDAINKINQYRINSLHTNNIHKHIEILEVLKKNQKETFFNLLKDKVFAKTLMVDIFCNADRRKEQGRYDDGIIRLYRVLELISQHRLALKGVDVSKVTIEDEKVHKDFEELSKSLYGAPKGISEKIALMDGWILLKVIGDEVIKEMDMKTFMDRLHPRNELLIEHKNTPGKNKQFKDFRDFVLLWLKKIVEESDKKINSHRFIQLPL